MVSNLPDRDIINFLLEEDEGHEDDIIFNSSDEECHEATEENHEIDLAALEEDYLEVVADVSATVSSDSDSEMAVPLSELASQPSGRIYKGKDGTLWHKIPARSNIRTRSETV